MANELADLRFHASAAFPGSKKVYVEAGGQSDIRVPMREITLEPTSGRHGTQENPPVRVYDTSGPYTDSAYQANFRNGIPRVRRNWVLKRADVEEYAGRPVQPVDNGLSPVSASALLVAQSVEILLRKTSDMKVYPGLAHRPLRARTGSNVTQLHYAPQRNCDV